MSETEKWTPDGFRQPSKAADWVEAYLDPEVEALRAEVEALRFYQATVQAGLTPLERRIACKLYEEGETGITASDLSKMLYGFAHPVEQKTVRTLVGRIRRKMAPLGWVVSNPGGGRGRPVGSFTVERVKDARKKR